MTGRTITLPRAAVMRGFVMSQLIHHRAQLGVYLPLLEVPVPAIFGPSADNAASRLCQNRERTGLPREQRGVGWWMRPD